MYWEYGICSIRMNADGRFEPRIMGENVLGSYGSPALALVTFSLLPRIEVAGRSRPMEKSPGGLPPQHARAAC